jgi:hypothetical protein
MEHIEQSGTVLDEPKKKKKEQSVEGKNFFLSPI